MPVIPFVEVIRGVVADSRRAEAIPMPLARLGRRSRVARNAVQADEPVHPSKRRDKKQHSGRRAAIPPPVETVTTLPSVDSILSTLSPEMLQIVHARLPKPTPDPAASDTLADEGMMCSICYDLFVDPVLTPCAHPFCRLCIHKVLTNAPTSARKKCPLCVASLADCSAESMAPATAVLQRCQELPTMCGASGCDFRAPLVAVEQHMQRGCRLMQQLAAAAAAEVRDQFAKRIVVSVGNTYQLVEPDPKTPQCVHSWTAFVRIVPGDTDVRIKRVHFTLWSGRVVVCRKEPFEISRIGWGLFEVYADIFTTENPRSPHRVAIGLNFSAPETARQLSLMPNQMLEEFTQADVEARRPRW